MPSPAPCSSWPVGRLGDLADLVAAGLPDERLTPDELLAACWERGEVIGADDGSAAIVLVVEQRATVVLLVVHPDARRQRLGTALLAEAADRAQAAGAPAIDVGPVAGPSSSSGLWPGVDEAAMAPMAALLASAGFERRDSSVGLCLSTAFRHPVPDGVVLRRVLDDHDADAVRAIDPAVDPRLVDHGSCFVAVAAPGEGSAAALAFASHSVDRIGWLGPVAVADGVAPPDRTPLLAALGGEVCRDLAIASRKQLWIAAPDGDPRDSPWLDLGASVGRTFATFSRRLAGAPAAPGSR